MAEKQKTALGPTGETLKQNVRRLREGQKLTYVELSDRLAAAGRPIPVLGLRRIERGERRVDADDLVALAVVLGVNPSALLLPFTAEGDADITGVGTVSAERAWAWGDGRGPLTIPEGDDGTARVDFRRAARPAGLRGWDDAIAFRDAIHEGALQSLGGPEVRQALAHFERSLAGMTQEQREEAVLRLARGSQD